MTPDEIAHRNTDNAPVEVVLETLAFCAACWEPGVRLVGNIRADDIVRACLAVYRAITAEREARERAEAERDEAIRGAVAKRRTLGWALANKAAVDATTRAEKAEAALRDAQAALEDALSARTLVKDLHVMNAREAALREAAAELERHFGQICYAASIVLALIPKEPTA